MIRFVIEEGRRPDQTSVRDHGFVHFTGGRPASVEDRRLVRSQAMLSYKRRQREEKRKDRQAVERINPADDVNRLAMIRASVGLGTSYSPSLASIYRDAAAASFMTGYFPRDVHRMPIMDTCGEQWRSPRSKAMEAAIDAIYLLQMNSIVENAPVVLNARERQITSITYLRGDLVRAELDHIGLLATIAFLMFSEAYSVITGGSNNWESHIAGMIRVIVSCGPRIVESPFGTLLFRATRMCGLNVALLRRKEFVLGSGEWPDLLLAKPGSLEGLLQHAVQLPALLEQVDIIRDHAIPDIDSARDLIPPMLDLHGNIAAWLEAYAAASDLSMPSGRECPIGIFADMASMMETRLDTALFFDTFISASYHALYWCFLLISSSALLDVFDIIHKVGHSDTYDRANFNATGQDCARRLLQSIPYLCFTAEGNVATAGAVRSPLFYARAWFEHHGEPDLLACCDAFEHYIVETRASGLHWETFLPLSHYMLGCLME